MAFTFSESLINEYRTAGFVVLRQIVPASLITDLRRSAEQAREVCHRKHGVDAQRLQPIQGYPKEIDLAPFKSFQTLPDLANAIAAILSPRHRLSSVCAILFEPTTKAYCTNWHRDWRDDVAHCDLELWDRLFFNYDIFNQFNCPLYEDSCTWHVPGSHLRGDLPSERKLFPVRPIPYPQYPGSPAEVERRNLEYCQQMPNAQRVWLDPGDFLVYRNTGWHIGNYVPGKKRATIHSGAMTPEWLRYRVEANAAVERRQKEGLPPWIVPVDFPSGKQPQVPWPAATWEEFDEAAELKAFHDSDPGEKHRSPSD